MSEDVRLFTTNVLGYLLIVINSAITLIAFLGVLWGISPRLVLLLFGYAAAGTAISVLIGGRLVGLHFTQYQREADFRYGLVRVRDNAESIAFYRGEKREQLDLARRFVEVVRNTLRIIGWNRNLAFFGSGKSSLLRTIAGLWQSGSGGISRPTLNRMMFLPQRPYMVQGSLRAQVLYPQPENSGDDDEIKKAFALVNLDEVLARVDGDLAKELDWTNVLSLGEQQRVSFARLLLKKPVIAFLDEATSALDEPNERVLYERLRELGIAFVSVGHRSTLKAFHDHLLVLHCDGSWELEELEPEDEEQPTRPRKKIVTR